MGARPSTPRLLTLRRADTCAGCRARVDAGARGWWDPAGRTVTCVACHAGSPAPDAPTAAPEPPIDRGTPGASAQRQYEQRRDARDRRIRERWGPLGGLAVALSDEPAHQRNWAVGAQAEREIGSFLERGADGRAILLHDRRRPGSRANIDHLAVGAGGVFVIDAKRYKGQIRVRHSGGVLRPRQTRLMIGRRDQTALLEGVLAQARDVGRVLHDAGLEHVDVSPVLCFLRGDLPLMTRAARRVALCGPKRTLKLVRTDGPIGEGERAVIADLLAAKLPPAGR